MNRQKVLLSQQVIIDWVIFLIIKKHFAQLSRGDYAAKVIFYDAPLANGRQWRDGKAPNRKGER